MISYKRPQAPSSFDVPPSQKIAEARQGVERAVQGALPPDFPNLWKEDEVRRRLAQAQHNKCGYCESILATDPPEVEHYAPKGEVEELIAMGQERSGLINVDGRRTHTLHSIGYWWMAYQWRNYLMACDRCNSAWKRSVFSVAESPRQAPARSEAEIHKRGWPWMGESPALLNPFDTLELPAHHFSYGPSGEICGLTGRAVETIMICGLDRPSLRQQRAKVYRSNLHRIRDYLSTPELSEREESRLLRDLHTAGSADQAYAAVVRWLIARHLDMRWDEFERAAQTRSSSS